MSNMFLCVLVHGGPPSSPPGDALIQFAYTSHSVISKSVTQLIDKFLNALPWQSSPPSYTMPFSQREHAHGLVRGFDQQACRISPDLDLVTFPAMGDAASASGPCTAWPALYVGLAAPAFAASAYTHKMMAWLSQENLDLLSYQLRTMQSIAPISGRPRRVLLQAMQNLSSRTGPRYL